MRATSKLAREEEIRNCATSLVAPAVEISRAAVDISVPLQGNEPLRSYVGPGLV